MTTIVTDKYKEKFKNEDVIFAVKSNNELTIAITVNHDDAVQPLYNKQNRPFKRVVLDMAEDNSSVIGDKKIVDGSYIDIEDVGDVMKEYGVKMEGEILEKLKTTFINRLQKLIDNTSIVSKIEGLNNLNGLVDEKTQVLINAYVDNLKKTGKDDIQNKDFIEIISYEFAKIVDYTEDYNKTYGLDYDLVVGTVGEKFVVALNEQTNYYDDYYPFYFKNIHTSIPVEDEIDQAYACVEEIYHDYAVTIDDANRMIESYREKSFSAEVAIPRLISHVVSEYMYARDIDDEFDIHQFDDMRIADQKLNKMVNLWLNHMKTKIEQSNEGFKDLRFEFDKDIMTKLKEIYYDVDDLNERLEQKKTNRSSFKM